ncbi:GNAT family protein [Achromobacter dolens]|uniref:GNAT family N-acetyltransferase n=1 Tax=Achromobacter dolens TaxID=1287738 RepID=UPI00300CD2B3
MLVGKRIGIDAPREKDSAALYRWVNSPATVAFSAPFKPIPESAHRTWFQNQGTDPTRVLFIIRDLATEKAIGLVQLVDIHPVHRRAELTIRIGEDSDRGHGAGVEALKLTIEFAWRHLNLQRIWLRVFEDNHRAIRAYEKAGFQIEGVMRQSAWIEGRWVDEVVMAILREN